MSQSGWSWRHVMTTVAIITAVLLAFYLSLSVGEHVTHEDRMARMKHTEACVTIKDETLRTLCLRDHG